MRQVGGDKVEIPAIAGEAGKAEDRRAVAVILVVKREAVSGLEGRHQRPASPGMPVRSDRK